MAGVGVWSALAFCSSGYRDMGGEPGGVAEKRAVAFQKHWHSTWPMVDVRRFKQFVKELVLVKRHYEAEMVYIFLAD